MRTVAKKGSVIIIEEDRMYTVKDLETETLIYKDAKHIQIAEEEFLHYWRKKYMDQNFRHDLYASSKKTYGTRF